MFAEIDSLSEKNEVLMRLLLVLFLFGPLLFRVLDFPGIELLTIFTILSIYLKSKIHLKTLILFSIITFYSLIQMVVVSHSMYPQRILGFCFNTLLYISLVFWVSNSIRDNISEKVLRWCFFLLGIFYSFDMFFFGVPYLTKELGLVSLYLVLYLAYLMVSRGSFRNFSLLDVVAFTSLSCVVIAGASLKSIAALIVLAFWKFTFRARLSFIITSSVIIFVLMNVSDLHLVQKIIRYNDLYGSLSPDIARVALYTVLPDILLYTKGVGLGVGVFGSLPVTTYYSEFYYTFGLSDIWGLEYEALISDNYPSFLLDANISSLVGEYGLFSLVVIYFYFRVMVPSGKSGFWRLVFFLLLFQGLFLSIFTQFWIFFWVRYLAMRDYENTSYK